MHSILNIYNMITNEINKFYAKERAALAAFREAIEIFRKPARVEIINAETGEIIANSWDDE